MANQEAVSVFSKVNDDILLNILERLPAEAFACAACVSKTWNNKCSSILCRPKFVSAFSLNPDLPEAVDEVFDEVFSKPIRPDFAIVYVGMEFSLPLTSHFVFKKLPHGVPIIINQAMGLLGVDAKADEILEVKWEWENVLDYRNEDTSTGGGVKGGLMLSVGYLPDLIVDVVPLLRQKNPPHLSLMEYFLVDMRSFTRAISGSNDPSCVTIIGDHNADIRPFVEKLHREMPEETAIVGDAQGSFMYRRKVQTSDYSADLFFIDAAALVFARDKNKSEEVGETRFHVTVADGIIPFGPQLRSVSVIEDPFAQSWIRAEVEGAEEGGYPMLDCAALLQQLRSQLDMGDQCFYIEVGKRRQYSTEFKTTLACYELLGGTYESIIVKGCGIQPGDRFIFLHSDPGSALTRVDDARQTLEAMGANEEVFGGLIFSSYRRDKSFFGVPCVDMTPFSDKLRGAAVAGISCTREIGRGALLGPGLGYCFNAHSCVYLAMSYVPPMSK